MKYQEKMMTNASTASLLKRLGGVSHNGNVFYNAKPNFNLPSPRRGNLLFRQSTRPVPTRGNLLLKYVDVPARSNKEEALRSVLANVRSRLRKTGHRLY